MPRPIEILLRIFDEPVPAYTIFGLVSATSTAPTGPTEIWPSVIGSHVWPASTVFHTPPPTVPM